MLNITSQVEENFFTRCFSLHCTTEPKLNTCAVSEFITKYEIKLAGVCKTLCPQHLLVPRYGQICSAVIPQTFNK